MVSTMSATSRLMAGAVGSATGSARLARTGWPIRAILSIAMALYGTAGRRGQSTSFDPCNPRRRVTNRGRHGRGVDRLEAFWYHPAPLGNPRKTGATFADHRSRQQYRPGAQGAQKEDAA